MDELERLRDFARAYLAERRAWDEWTTPMHDRLERGDRSKLSEEEIERHRRRSAIYRDRKDDLGRALVRLREVAPELFAD